MLRWTGLNNIRWWSWQIQETTSCHNFCLASIQVRFHTYSVLFFQNSKWLIRLSQGMTKTGENICSKVLLAVHQKRLGLTVDRKYLRIISGGNPWNATLFFTVAIVQFSQLITPKTNMNICDQQLTAILPQFTSIQLISNAAQSLWLGDKVMVLTFKGILHFWPSLQVSPTLETQLTGILCTNQPFLSGIAYLEAQKQNPQENKPKSGFTICGPNPGKLLPNLSLSSFLY